jgi:hypothetical protein
LKNRTKQLAGYQEFAAAWNAWAANGGTSKDFAASLGMHATSLYNKRVVIEKALGITLPTMTGSPIAAARVRVQESMGALRGWAPEHDMTHEVPEGFVVGGVSTLYVTGEDGQTRVASQWVKSKQDAASRENLLRAAAEGMASEIPRAKPVPAPRQAISELLNAYVLTDFHLGMLAWKEETGADWDLGIAERMLVDWFTQAIALAPAAHTAVFAQLGDFLHWDGLDAVTPQHKNLLDADTRFQKLVRVAIRAIRQVIAALLTKHLTVHVILAEGNHDPASSIWLRELFTALYENEPRIIVNRSPDPYYCLEHGKTALFFHHGHLRKTNTVDAVLAGKFREVFGRTKYNYAHTGHLHHVELRETSLMVVEQHRTLAAPDAYASRGGWISGRDAQVITYHKEFGEVGRNKISSHMVDTRRAA